MTLDHDWLIQNLDRLKVGLVEDGTAIGSGMAAGASRLNDKKAKSRVLIVLTDGENNAGKIPPNTAAEAIKALGIKLYAIGAGINGIAPAPVPDRRGGFLTDLSGNMLYQNQPVHFNEAGLEGSRAHCGRQILPRHGHRVARADLQRDRQDGEVDGQREEVPAVPRSVSGLHHGRLRRARSRRCSCRRHSGGSCREFWRTALALGVCSPCPCSRCCFCVPSNGAQQSCASSSPRVCFRNSERL